jgi:pimeloyl-ACP methyl ester carboxylesterase
MMHSTGIGAGDLARLATASRFTTPPRVAIAVMWVALALATTLASPAVAKPPSSGGALSGSQALPSPALHLSAGVPSPPVEAEFMPGYVAPGTPESLDKVGVIKVGSPQARNVLVLEPGTSAAGAYFVPLAKWIAETLPGWQVWAVVRRESLLEDQSVLNLAKEGKASSLEVFNYYLGWILNPVHITHHIQLIPEEAVGYARDWGMKVAVEDLHHVIEAAHRLGGHVVLGGHSLGGSVVTAYATWNFGGEPGADGLSGLVYDDGGSSPTPVSAEQAEGQLGQLAEKSPWLAFGGIPSPFLGLFSALGATATIQYPQEAALAEGSGLLPNGLVPKNHPGCKLTEPGCEAIPVTNEALFGYGVDVGTSPPELIAGQVHAGKGVQEAAMADGLHGWDGEGALSPLRRYAEMLSGTGLQGLDGVEWYFPERLTIDTGAVAEGNENPAQKVLEVEATQGHKLPHYLQILAIDTELDRLLEGAGGGNSLQAAQVLAAQSGIPQSHLELLDKENTYAHNDPAAAYPSNAFFEALVPYLMKIGGI